MRELRRWTGVIHVKRVHEPPSEADGRRILVDRLWPRGLSRDRVRLDAWIRDLAPTPELRRWFGHAPERWPEFLRRYQAELAANPDLPAILARELRGERVTFLFGARDERHNNAVALKAYVESQRAAAGESAAELAEPIRQACIEAATRAYEDGGVRGLCAEGRWELALDAMRQVELERCVDISPRPGDPLAPGLDPDERPDAHRGGALSDRR